MRSQSSFIDLPEKIPDSAFSAWRACVPEAADEPVTADAGGDA